MLYYNYSGITHILKRTLTIKSKAKPLVEVNMKGGTQMQVPRKTARDALLQLWEQAVLLHQRLKTDPSVQCAWDLAKLVIRLIFKLLKLYIAFR